jgi:hypothetical protein
MTTMLRLLAIPLVLAGFLFVGGPPCTNVPTLIAAARSLDSGQPCLCALNPNPLQQLNNGSLQAAPTAQPADEVAAGEENDELVSVQMLVFALALAAAAVGLLGYLLRRHLGLDQMPPPDDGPSHH